MDTNKTTASLSLESPLSESKKSFEQSTDNSSKTITINNVQIIDLTDDDSANQPCLVPSSIANSSADRPSPQPILVDLTVEDGEIENDFNKATTAVAAAATAAPASARNNIDLFNEIMPFNDDDFSLSSLLSSSVANPPVAGWQTTTTISNSSSTVASSMASSVSLGINTHFQPEPRSYLGFLRKMLDENWKWANSQDSMQMRVFCRSQITDLLVSCEFLYIGVYVSVLSYDEYT